MSRIFVSHASEDKADLVRPLAHLLRHKGLDVWYDEFALIPGDSLRQSIDKGLRDCSTGLLILSHSFFQKQWPQRELDALFTAEIHGNARIVPVWHNISALEVAEFSPLLADRVCINSVIGVEEVANKIAELFPPISKYTGESLAGIIEMASEMDPYVEDARYSGAQYRFMLMQAVNAKYHQFADEQYSSLSDEELDESHPEIDKKIAGFLRVSRALLGVPEDVYLDASEPEPEDRIPSWKDALGHWASGTLDAEESRELVTDLDTRDLDEYYILLGVPNFSFSSEQRDLLDKALVLLGHGFETGYEELVPVCEALRALDK